MPEELLFTGKESEWQMSAVGAVAILTGNKLSGVKEVELVVGKQTIPAMGIVERCIEIMRRKDDFEKKGGSIRLVGIQIPHPKDKAQVLTTISVGPGIVLLEGSAKLCFSNGGDFVVKTGRIGLKGDRLSLYNFPTRRLPR